MSARRPLWHPSLWLTWAGLGILRLLVMLPYPLQYKLGASIGRALGKLVPRRTNIARVNLGLCFPELDREGLERLVTAHLESFGIGLLEVAGAWWTSAERLRGRTEVQGFEHLEAAMARGRGVILLTAHFTTLEMGGRLLAVHAALPYHALYRAHENPALEWAFRTYKERHYEKIIPRDDIRGMLRSLKNGHPVWYAADQDYHGPHRIFTPFFGVAASTNPATSRIARSARCPVVPFFPLRKIDGSGYIITILPALDDFPSDDLARDATRINQLIEEHVRRAPEQYFWVHRRFKTRPPGEPDPYARKRPGRED